MAKWALHAAAVLALVPAGLAESTSTRTVQITATITSTPPGSGLSTQMPQSTSTNYLYSNTTSQLPTPAMTRPPDNFSSIISDFIPGPRVSGCAINCVVHTPQTSVIYWDPVTINTTITHATVVVMTESGTNRTRTTTKFNTDLGGYAPPTDTDSAGTKTTVFSWFGIPTSHTTTLTFPNSFWGYDNNYTWTGTLLTSSNGKTAECITATKPSVIPLTPYVTPVLGISTPIPSTARITTPGDTYEQSRSSSLASRTSADPRGWAFTAVLINGNNEGFSGPGYAGEPIEFYESSFGPQGAINSCNVVTHKPQAPQGRSFTAAFVTATEFSMAGPSDFSSPPVDSTASPFRPSASASSAPSQTSPPDNAPPLNTPSTRSDLGEATRTSTGPGPAKSSISSNGRGRSPGQGPPLSTAPPRPGGGGSLPDSPGPKTSTQAAPAAPSPGSVPAPTDGSSPTMPGSAQSMASADSARPATVVDPAGARSSGTGVNPGTEASTGGGQHVPQTLQSSVGSGTSQLAAPSSVLAGPSASVVSGSDASAGRGPSGSVAMPFTSAASPFVAGSMTFTPLTGASQQAGATSAGLPPGTAQPQASNGPTSGIGASAAVPTQHGSPDSFLIGGQTLAQGGPAVTVGGTPYSLAPGASSVVVGGSSTIALTPAPISTAPSSGSSGASTSRAAAGQSTASLGASAFPTNGVPARSSPSSQFTGAAAELPQALPLGSFLLSVLAVFL